jgi:hypothetical protein
MSKIASSSVRLTDSTDDELAASPRSAEGRDLDNDTDDQDNSAREHHLAATEAISEHQGEDCAGQATDLVDSWKRGISTCIE